MSAEARIEQYQIFDAGRDSTCTTSYRELLKSHSSWEWLFQKSWMTMRPLSQNAQCLFRPYLYHDQYSQRRRLFQGGHLSAFFWAVRSKTRSTVSEDPSAKRLTPCLSFCSHNPTHRSKQGKAKAIYQPCKEFGETVTTA
jgi:hypothetical protein